MSEGVCNPSGASECRAIVGQRSRRSERHPFFFAAFFLAAHIAFIRFLAASRCAGEKLRFLRAVSTTGSAGTSARLTPDPGGRPRRFVPTPSAWIARSILSRSAMSNARMWSVGINEIVLGFLPLLSGLFLLPYQAPFVGAARKESWRRRRGAWQ